MYKIPTIIITIFSLFLFTNSAYADAGDRKIRIVGNTVDDAKLRVSVKELEQKFQLLNITSYNPWEKKTTKHTGILINELIDKLAKPDTETIIFKAIDDYQVEIERNKWQKFRIVLVTREDGNYLSVKNKGPMRIIFPDYDASKKEYEANLPLWMWMIKQVEFK